MIMAIRLIITLILIMLPLTVSSAAQEIIKVKTVDELAARYESSSCKNCHPEIYAQWEKSLHSRSIFGPFESARTAATIKTAIENGLKKWPYSGVKQKEDVKVKHLMMCAKCHLPQLIEADDSVAQEIVKNIYAFADGDEKAGENLRKLNIGCLICHNRNAIVHKWADGYPQKTAVYGKKDGTHGDPTHPELKKSPIMQEAILCGQCHGLGPNLELEEPSQCATLYGSYLWAYQAEGGRETCQECHMQKSGLGHNMQSYRSPEMAKMAIDFKADAYAYLWRDGANMKPKGLITVELTNKAGHAIPDG
jgi:hypothetical protein